MTALARLAGALRCPVCAGALAVADRSLCCGLGHSFDIARQGHVNLTGRAAPGHADTAEMVAARARFLDTGAYAPIAAALVERAPESGLAVDAGAGPGWYARQILQARPALSALALDVSPAAARTAARAHPRLAAVVADTWRDVPVGDRRADLITCVFAPRNVGEFARVLRPGGLLLIVTPGPDHLAELRDREQMLGIEPAKLDRLDTALGADFEITDRSTVRGRLALDRDQVRDLINMGPNAFHAAADDPEPIVTGLAVEVTTARRR
ncbi:putative RNA methyltransferase [Naumannella cuiyingiana]|uniref:23S rRNA (Guanine745-N1)-methyltransferase n=1 Tax=Naumannella cuiyingiana TaxID=1347891 RepID=A0A7Z0DAU5_9ACTN|nr:23S rRNA (guanine745-N1)-methyltransferase [Naumannella cuiyingiana]